MSLERFFESLGLSVVTAIIVILIAEGVVRVALKPAIQSDFTVKRALSNQELCKGADEPYDKAGECYNLYDSLAKMNFSTYFGYVPTPGESGRGYYTNRATMRYSEELNSHKAKGEYRVFVTGGSTAWGAGVPQDQLYSTKAEELLQKRFSNRSVKVISAGVGGYVSLHEVLRYMFYIRPLAPDVWVMFTGWNDVYANYRGRDYVLSPDMLNLRSAILLGARDNPIIRERLVEVAQGDFNADLKQPLWSEYTYKLHWLIDKALYKLSLRAKKSNETPAANSLNKQDEKADALTELLLTNVSLAAHLARRDGIKLVVLLQPSVYSTKKRLSKYESNMVEEAVTKFPRLEADFRVIYPALRQRLKDASIAEGFVFLDSDDAISTEERTVFADHVHLGDRGNALIGSYLASSLEKILH